MVFLTTCSNFYVEKEYTATKTVNIPLLPKIEEIVSGSTTLIIAKQISPNLYELLFLGIII